MSSSSKPILFHDKECEERGSRWVLSDSQLCEYSRRTIGVNRRILLKHVLGYLVTIENNHLAAKEIEANDIAYDFISKFDDCIDALTSCSNTHHELFACHTVSSK